MTTAEIDPEEIPGHILRRFKVAIIALCVALVCLGSIFTTVYLHEQSDRLTRAGSCQFYRDAGNIPPVTPKYATALNPATSPTGLRIIADARNGFAALKCSPKYGELIPADPVLYPYLTPSLIPHSVGK